MAGRASAALNVLSSFAASLLRKAQPFAAGATALTGRGLSSNVMRHRKAGMKSIPQIRQMASGNLSLIITEDVSWETFPDQAQEFVAWAGGRVLMKMESPIEPMWIVLIKWRPFFLAFDDFPLGMSLDSMNWLCNSVVRELHQKLTSAAA